MIKRLINHLFSSKVDALGLAIFRMCYTVILCCAVVQLFTYRNIIYDKIPFIEQGEIYSGFIFIIWFIILFMLFVGLFTRTATIINYIFTIIIFSSAQKFEYHVYYAFIGINFLLMFMPISRLLSFDSLIQKLKYTGIGRPFKVQRQILEINYLAVVYVVLGLVYFDSIFRKLDSAMWTDGLGVWLPSSLPMIVWNDLSFILNQEFIIKFLGYFVLAFEAVFIFLIWFKKFRIPLLVIGVFFHIGILVTYPIPWFALTSIIVYLLLIPQDLWVRISNLATGKNTTYNFYYDVECPLCNKVVVMIRHFDIFNKINRVTVQGYASNDSALTSISEEQLLINIHGVDRNGRVYVGFDAYVQLFRHMIYLSPIALLLKIPGISHGGRKMYQYIAGNRLTERCTVANCAMPTYTVPMAETDDFLVAGWNKLNISRKFWKALLLFFTLWQLVLIITAPIFKRHIRDNFAGRAIIKTSNMARMPIKKVFGITYHSVYIYNIHFAGYNHIFKIVCNNNNKVVPLLNDDGMLQDSYARDGLYNNYTGRVSGPTLDQKTYQNGVVPYLRYFERQNNLMESSYTIYVKEIETTEHWQKDFLRHQIARPWKRAGSCKLSPSETSFEWTGEMQQVFESEQKLLGK